MSDDIANQTVSFATRDVPNALSFIFKNKPTQTQISHAMAATGKQSMQSLVGSKQKLAGFEITAEKIQGFDKIAKRYGMGYAVLKHKTEPNRWMVYFKGKDVDLIQDAFKEYTATRMKAIKIEKPSILNKIKNIKKDAAKVALKAVQKKVDISL